MNNTHIAELLNAMQKEATKRYGMTFDTTEIHDEDINEIHFSRYAEALADLEHTLVKMRDENHTYNDQSQHHSPIYQKAIDSSEETDIDIDEKSFLGLLKESLSFPHGMDKRDSPRFFANERRHYKRILYKECRIAGISFHNIEDIWDHLHQGMRLALVRDRYNKYDHNAIAVALLNDYDGTPEDFDFDLSLGYIPHTQNKTLAALLDMGWDDVLECEISQINEKLPYSERIHIAIYIVNKEIQEQQDRQPLQALSLTEDEYVRLTSSLEEKGFVDFHWGGFPTWERFLPEDGNQVVFIYQRDQQVVLYFMFLIASGDRSNDFLGQVREPTCDDCYDFFFTNIKGPILLPATELDFLETEKIDTNQPETYLSEQASEKLKTIFNRN